MSKGLTDDPGEIFAVLLQFNGDVTRTASTLQLEDDTVRALATKHGWLAKIQSYTGPDAAGKEGRTINRAVNFLLAHRLRSLVDKVATNLGQDDDMLTQALVVTNAAGSRVDMKVLRDLADAGRIASEMTYRALGDSMDQTIADGKGDPKKKATATHLSVMEAMDRADCNPKVSVVELVHQDVKANEKAVRQSSPTRPGAPRIQFGPRGKPVAGHAVLDERVGPADVPKHELPTGAPEGSGG